MTRQSKRGLVKAIRLLFTDAPKPDTPRILDEFIPTTNCYRNYTNPLLC